MADSMAPFLPEDLLLEILYRLPVKALIRLTCVCKQWLSLIRCPQFATKQLLTTHSNLWRDNFQYFFTVTAGKSEDGVTDRVIASLFSYESFELSARFEFNPCSHITISDPCRGIFCVHVSVDYRETTFLLWNPSIREVELLPFPLPPPVPEQQPQQDYRTSFFVQTFGFGYDCEINDYKVFVIFGSSTRASRDRDWPVGVYNLREGYWKFLPTKSFDKSIRDFLPWSGLKRAILTGRKWNWIMGGSLFSFDLTDQIFIKTPIPGCWKQQQAFLSPTLLQTNKMEAKPRVMCLHHGSTQDDVYNIEIWELDEYGSSGCWSKQIVIGFPYDVQPLGYWQDEEALIWPHLEQIDINQGEVIVGPLRTYNSITKELKSTGFMHASELIATGCAYIESLVSVKELCRHHNQHQQQHEPQYDWYLTTDFSVREVNAPTSSINTFPSYCIECYED
ncbi:hypothetical protein Dimus_015168 [Dionaea muscipula]